MHFDPGVDLPHGGGACVEQTGGRGAYQHDLARQLLGGQPPGHHIGGGHVGTRATLWATGAPEWHQTCGAVVHRDGDALVVAGVQLDAGQTVGPTGARGQTRRHPGLPQQPPEHGKRQGFVVLALELRNQRGAAHHTVGVGHGVKKPGLWRSVRQLRDVGTVTVPGGDLACQAWHSPLAHDWRGQHPACAAVAVAGEVVAQHHLTPGECLGKLAVKVQLGLQGAQLRGKAGLALRCFLGQFLQGLQARAGVGIGKQHVKTYQGYFLLDEQRVGQAGECVAAPGPVANLCQALLVDVDHHNAAVQGARHGGPQAGVVNEVVQLLHHSQRQPARGM